MVSLSSRPFVLARVPWARLADVASGVSLTIALIVARTGGFTIDLGAFQFAAHDVWRPVAIAGVVTLARLMATRRTLWLAHLAAGALMLQAVAAQYEPGTGFTSFIAFGDQ